MDAETNLFTAKQIDIIEKLREILNTVEEEILQISGVSDYALQTFR